MASIDLSVNRHTCRWSATKDLHWYSESRLPHANLNFAIWWSGRSNRAIKSAITFRERRQDGIAQRSLRHIMCWPFGPLPTDQLQRISLCVRVCQYYNWLPACINLYRWKCVNNEHGSRLMPAGGTSERGRDDIKSSWYVSRSKMWSINNTHGIINK